MAFCNIRYFLNLVLDSSLRDKLLAFDEKYMMVYEKSPASTSFHHSYAGGYYDHIAQVTFIATSLFDFMSRVNTLPFSKDDVILVSYFHDLDKIVRYAPTKDDWKRKKGTMWDTRSDYPIVDESCKVVQMCANEGIFFQNIHLEAITLHHGGWSNRLSGTYAYPSSEFPPLASILHSADILSASILGHVEGLSINLQ